ncbi:hypothetical protein L226DRAFT_615534 [Lentinus tigrinus ALCF2SS1-7]|uniref:Uncharacterized protein n=1 Tax=Lentinus tigrinus ALCF2SS1-6 TaxID=1328759 RepID=A0A5C2RZ32_9APHY|nr:hypothetical protein L227DRAFT_656183 [Lentinus tigrinus ALCF2SS1-6]RPD71532.1 hypothetical protein L226DRAFT_615534 [Lentinus tigrinus ALCF2SS1-7]
MSSSNTPAPATSALKYPRESMKHWTPDLVTEDGESVPPGVVVYALGCAFPEGYLRPLAQAICSSELLEKYPDKPLTSLVFHFIENQLSQTFLRTCDPETDEPLMMWVLCVVPGTLDKPPPQRIGPKEWAPFDAYLLSRGVSKDILKGMANCVMRWPRGAAYPIWVPEAILRHLAAQRHHDEVAKQKAREELTGS